MSEPGSRPSEDGLREKAEGRASSDNQKRVAAFCPEPSAVETCSRCDVPMEYQTRDESGFFAESWFCPCCRSRTRTPAMIEATASSRSAEMGMTRDEYHEHCSSFIDPRRLDPAALRGLQAMVGERADEWRPACEHDTNPWLSASPVPEEQPYESFVAEQGANLDAPYEGEEQP